MSNEQTTPLVTDREASHRRITPEMVAVEMARVGKELRSLGSYVETANADAIRHWAHGIGDMNPLWTDEAYAVGTRWKGIVAPPTMVLCLDRNVLSSGPRGFPGLHGWHLGCSFEWLGPIVRDHSFRGRAWMESIEEVESSYAGGVAYDQTILTEIVDTVDDSLVCTARSFIRRFERDRARETKKYTRPAKQAWEGEEIQAIAERYRAEKLAIRGATPRYVDDVKVGGGVGELVRGPLTVTDCMAFNMGWGGAYVFAHGFAYEFLHKAPGAFPPNESNIPDSPERTHWVDAFAQQIGAPAAFDYGPQRVSWAGTLLTNWIGDDGFLSYLKVRILRPNYHGDLVTYGGRITDTDIASGTVEIVFEATNQLGEIVADGTATATLPRRKS
jgi:acyl dehydratase